MMDSEGSKKVESQLPVPTTSASEYQASAMETKQGIVSVHASSPSDNVTLLRQPQPVRAARPAVRPASAVKLVKPPATNRVAKKLPVTHNKTSPATSPSLKTSTTPAVPSKTPAGKLAALPAVPDNVPKLAPAAARFVQAVPMRREKQAYGSIISFMFCVAVPVICAAVYYLAIASGQYVSEVRFAIRDAKSGGGTVSSSAVGGLSGFMSAMTSSNPQENFIVADFLKSRQAVEELSAAINIRHLYSRPEADWWARFDESRPMEDFTRYWRRMLSASYDQVTGIATAEVRAFTPEDAYLIASTLVKLSEELINKISNRPQRDAVRFAEEDVKRAEDRLQLIRAELTRYRNAEQLIDPQANVVTSNVMLAQALRTTLSQLQTEYTALEKEKSLSRNAPARVSTEKRIAATREQLAAVEGQIANMRDGANPLSKVVAEYERLDLERQFAQNMMLSTMQKLEEARASLLAQHVYVTPYVQPALPQSSTYPKRFLSIAVVGLLCSVLWVVGLLVVRSVREHLN